MSEEPIAAAEQPQSPATPTRSLSRQFSELMDPEVKKLLANVKLGKDKEVKAILGQSPSILKDAVDMYGNSVLHLAALNGHKRIVKEVLRNADYFDPYCVNKKGLSAVDLAREFNYPDLADYIRSKLPGIPEVKAAAPLSEEAVEQKLGHLDEVSDALARVQAEREQLEREQELRMQELMLAKSTADLAVKKNQEQLAREKEMEEKMAAMELQAKAEQERLERCFQEKLQEMEEANKREREERLRLADEKVRACALPACVRAEGAARWS